MPVNQPSHVIDSTLSEFDDVIRECVSLKDWLENGTMLTSEKVVAVSRRNRTRHSRSNMSGTPRVPFPSR
jgi:hypothetical protein